jgi:hypothetical protein
MTDDEIAGRGVVLAADAIRLSASGQDQALLDLFNTAPEPEMRWCALYLAGAIREVAKGLSATPEQAHTALRRAAEGAKSDDAVTTAAKVLIDAWWRQNGDTQ